MLFLRITSVSQSGRAGQGTLEQSMVGHRRASHSTAQESRGEEEGEERVAVNDVS